MKWMGSRVHVCAIVSELKVVRWYGTIQRRVSLSKPAHQRNLPKPLGNRNRLPEHMVLCPQKNAATISVPCGLGPIQSGRKIDLTRTLQELILTFFTPVTIEVL